MKIFSPTGTLLNYILTADWAGFNFVKFPTLTPGTYKVTVEAIWLKTDTPDYTVRVYGNTTVNITTLVGKKIMRGLSNPIISNFSERTDGTFGPPAYKDG
jgi:hypothetical protein